MDYQIVKDLHRKIFQNIIFRFTRQCNFENLKFSQRTANIGSNEEQQTLKRILLAYARYNTECGYCQGFNVIVGTVHKNTKVCWSNILRRFTQRALMKCMLENIRIFFTVKSTDNGDNGVRVGYVTSLYFHYRQYFTSSISFRKARRDTNRTKGFSFF